MKKLPLLFVLVLAISSSSVLVACGGSDESSDAPTKTEFIAQADEICSSGDEEIATKAREEFGDKAPNKEETIAFISDEVVPNIEDQASQLRELTPPEGDEDAYNELLDSLDDGISTIADDPASSIGQENPLADANAKAQAYGFKSCGNS